jgi:DNA-binding PadR family transcriptional regulator
MHPTEVAMSLKHAILGFLNYGPLSGYDLKAAFDTSVQHFWPADQSQIYRTLAALADEGFAEVELVEQESRPDRKVYHITQAGRDALHSWLTTPISHEPARSAALVQVFFAGQLPDDEILAIFEQAAAEMRALLAHYAGVPDAAQAYIDWVDSPREVFFWLLTLECGVGMARAQLAWLESVIERLEARQVPAA